MYLTVTYDVTSTKTRNRIVKLLESYGFRVQKSVFEIQCNESQFRRLKKDCEKMLKYAEDFLYEEGHDNIDSVKFYVLSKVGEGSVDGRIDGVGEGYESVYFRDLWLI